jgi:hypothetical protein
MADDSVKDIVTAVGDINLDGDPEEGVHTLLTTFLRIRAAAPTLVLALGRPAAAADAPPAAADEASDGGSGTAPPTADGEAAQMQLAIADTTLLRVLTLVAGGTTADTRTL